MQLCRTTNQRSLEFLFVAILLLVATPAIGQDTYRSRVLQDAPIGYWGLDETDGTTAVNLGTLGAAADGNYFGASIQGGANVGRPGFGTGIRLGPGIITSGVEVNNALLDNRAEFTLSGWINPEAAEDSSRAGLFGQDNAVEFGFIGNNDFFGNLQIWTPDGGGGVDSGASELLYTFPNNEWHHIAVTGNAATGELLYYVDGLLAGAPGPDGQPIGYDTTTALPTDNFGGFGGTFNIGGGPIFGADRQFIGSIDEVAVFDRALSAEDIFEHFIVSVVEPPVLEINLGSGEAIIRGIDESPINLNGYEIITQQDALRPEQWESLESQGLDPVDGAADADNVPGNSTGETWQTVYAGPEAIIEGFLFGSTVVDPTVELSLGRIFDPAVGEDETLEFRFTIPSGGSQVGDIVFIPGGSGDFDADGDVDGSDFLQWQRDQSAGNLTDWQAQYAGAPAGSAAAAVPEPSALLGGILGLLIAGGYRTRRHS